MRTTLSVLSCLVILIPALGADFPAFRPQQIDPRVGEVCYALTLADVNGDGRADVVAGGRATHNLKVYWNLGRR